MTEPRITEKLTNTRGYLKLVSLLLDKDDLDFSEQPNE